MKAIMRDEQEMKNSGIEWLEFIPVQWNYSPIKRVVIDRSGGAWGEEPQNINDIICMRIADFDFERGFFADKDESLLTKRSYTNAQIEKLMLQYGDLLVEKSGGGENTPVGRAVLFNKEYDALFANFMDRLRFDMQTVYPLFVAYYWRAMYYKTVTTPYIKQTTGIQNLNIASLLEKEYIFYPSLKEQQLIANYLDDRCSKIDAIIAEAKASIEEYKELKQALISSKILCGMQPKAIKKSTNEKWLIEIPKHWRFEKGRHLFYEINVRSATGTEELLTVSQYTGITPRSQKNVTMIEAESLEDYKICEMGDIAANTMWMWAGAVGVSSYYGVISPSYNTYRQLHNDFNDSYLDYLLRTPEIVCEYASRSTGIRASRLRLYPAQFLSIYFPVPPKEEQIEIVEYLEQRLPKMDALISEKQSLITDLESYKKSLIYEVVTGKRKVVE